LFSSTEIKYKSLRKQKDHEEEDYQENLLYQGWKGWCSAQVSPHGRRLCSFRQKVRWYQEAHHEEAHYEEAQGHQKEEEEDHALLLNVEFSMDY
jgi:hypothetical protein